jgi:hypothetical protein
MQHPTNSNLFALTYGAGNYGACTYSDSNCATTATTNTSAGSSSGGGVLTDTGFDVILAVSFACLIIFVALVVRFWKKPKKNPTKRAP